MNIRDYIKNDIIRDKNKRILEIGPLNRPIVCKTEFPNSFYADIRSTEEVKKLYSGNDYLETTGIAVDCSTIVDIDYVLDETYKKTFQDVEKFDYIVASHVLEHVDDIIGTLKDFTSILKPGAKVCIIYPDKRFCFDHFRESASFRDAFEVHSFGAEMNARMVLDFYFSVIAENSPLKFWHPEKIENMLPQNEFDKARQLYLEAKSGQRMDDVHYWPFTDITFVKFLYDCVRAKLLAFHCAEFYPSQENSQEFFVVLEYDENIVSNPKNELNHLSQIIGSLPLDYYNADYAMGVGKSIEFKAQFYELQNELNTKNQRLELSEVEFEKYRKVVGQQQEALKEYERTMLDQQQAIDNFAEEIRKRDEIIKNNEVEFEKYRMTVKQQQAALEEYADALKLHNQSGIINE